MSHRLTPLGLSQVTATEFKIRKAKQENVELRRRDIKDLPNVYWPNEWKSNEEIDATVQACTQILVARKNFL